MLVTRRRFVLSSAAGGLALACGLPADAAERGDVRLRFVTDEADAVLAIAGAPHPSDADWARLHAAEGYVRLKEREAQFRRAFTDDAFAAFVRGDALRGRLAALRETVDAWRTADISGAETKALAYLPSGAGLRATVYIEIKPRANSFVFQLDSPNPGVFLNVDPTKTRAQFENTVAHELFHVGDAENCADATTTLSGAALSKRQQTFLTWLGAFGEGFAVLAAAGGPSIHPHASDPQADRDVWDAALATFDSDLLVLTQFFGDVLAGKLTGEAVTQKAMSFFGDVQGPWYTVGWKMATTIERAFGHARAAACACDRRSLLPSYNAAVLRAGLSLPRWPDAIAGALA